MARYPEGITGQRIFQKNVPGYFPGWITRAEVNKQDGVLQHVICDKPATLVYLANQACIELHVFLGRLGGSAGRTSWSSTWTAHVAEMTSVRRIEQRKDKRGHRLYVDVMRNAYAQTVVAPYVVRARPGAAVAVPLHWDELSDAALEPGRFTLRTVGRRLAVLDRDTDPWAGLTRHRYSLAAAQDRLDELAVRGVTDLAGLPDVAAESGPEEPPGCASSRSLPRSAGRSRRYRYPLRQPRGWPGSRPATPRL